MKMTPIQYLAAALLVAVFGWAMVCIFKTSVLESGRNHVGLPVEVYPFTFEKHLYLRNVGGGIIHAESCTNHWTQVSPNILMR